MTKIVLSAIVTTLILCGHQASGQPTTRPVRIVLEAEDGELVGTARSTTRPSFSGDGYVSGMDDADDKIILRATLPAAGLYAIDFRYQCEVEKRCDVFINRVGHSTLLKPTGDAFATQPLGKVELNAGENVLEIRRGWGYYDVDRIELIPTKLPNFEKFSAKLSNVNSSPAAVALLQRLVDSYGQRTLSGVYDREDASFVNDRTGSLPAILGDDLMDFSTSRVARGTRPKTITAQLLEDARAGHILTLSWHWNAPKDLIDKVWQDEAGKKIEAQWYFGFYARATTFNLPAALDNQAGEDYQLLIRDIDVIADQLKALQANGVPVLWRPLHEADAKHFWWGAHGSGTFKRLWSILYDRLTNHHKLNNLIWVYTGTSDWEWYPPDDQFDVIGVDEYPTDVRDPLSGTWDSIYARYGRKKLIALTEFGGVPDIDSMQRLGVHWAYYTSWIGDKGPRTMDDATLKRLIGSPVMSNLSTTRPAAANK